MLHAPLATLAALVSAPAAQDGFNPSAVLLRTPDVSATQIVFRYAGDLWTCPREGGTASRLTSAAGLEGLPKFSPDGKRVAFMADYDGGSEIYVVDVEGGTPRRITFHPGRETLSDWTPDGEALLFFSSEESGIARAERIFRVDVDGGQPEPLPVPYGTFCALEPGGTRLAYTPNTREGRTWRRYRGGMAQEVWLFDLETGTSTRVTNDPATDRMPMWHGGKLLFQSDRGEAGIANLYAYDPASGETRALTSLATSGARFPSIGPKDVVFEQSGGLFRYALDTGDIVRVEVTIPGDRPAVRAVTRELGGAIANHSVSRTGKRLAVEARGEIFSVPVEDGVTRNLTGTSDAAERAPALSPDGRFVAYWSDAPGEYELFVRRADGSKLEDGSDARRLTNTGGDWKATPRWSPDAEWIAWSNHDGALRAVKVSDGSDVAPREIGRASFPRFVDFDWSPDSNWIAWSARSSNSRLDALFLHDLGSGTTHEVTSGTFDDSNPVFSRDGEWLFFHSGRHFEPTYAEFDSTWVYRDGRQLMVVPLAADTELPWLPKNVEEDVVEDDPEGVDDAEAADEGAEDGADAAGEAKEDDAGATDEAAGDGEGEGESEAMRVDVEGFEGRIVAAPVPPGLAGGLVGTEDGALFARAENDGPPKVHAFSMGAHEDGDAPVAGPVSAYELSADGEHLMVVSGGKTFVVAPAPGQKLEDPVSFDAVRATFEPRAEWAQIIHDVHRLYRDWFYDPALHGVDWDGQRDRALAALPSATSREDVHFLIGEMIAELNVGHAYNRAPSGGFGGNRGGARAGLLGVDWEQDAKGYRVERVLGSALEHDARGPLTGRVEAGDVLVAVDGRPVDGARSVHEALLGTAGRTTLLTFERDGEEREVIAEPIRSERGLRYRDWVAAKRAYVHEATDGQVGYVHVPNTGVDGQTELYRQFLAERSKKALIVDERWNAGGQIPTRFIELLERKPTNAWAVRDGKIFEWPPVYHDGPKVMLINHSSGSGGDAFPWYFRRAGLGKLIGTRTWGGLVGISGNPALVDGAAPTVPTFGFFELDGTWAVEGHGVDPDIEVVDDPAEMQDGRDPQLEKALEVLRAEMESWPYAPMERPGSPNRSGAGITTEDR